MLPHHRMAFLLVGSCAVYGLTLNLVESASLLMALGSGTVFLTAQRSVIAPISSQGPAAGLPRPLA
jgi:hypothetical protein